MPETDITQNPVAPPSDLSENVPFRKYLVGTLERQNKKLDTLDRRFATFQGHCSGLHEALNGEIADLRKGRRDNAQAVVKVQEDIEVREKIVGGVAKFLFSQKGVLLAVILGFIGTGIWGHVERSQTADKLIEHSAKAATALASETKAAATKLVQANNKVAIDEIRKEFKNRGDILPADVFDALAVFRQELLNAGILKGAAPHPLLEPHSGKEQEPMVTVTPSPDRKGD